MTDNSNIVRRLYEDCINPGRTELLPDLVADEFVGPTGERGPSGFAETLASLRSGFPDIHFTIEDMIAERDRVAVRWTWRGSHTGQFRAFPATGKRLTNTGIAIYQVSGGKIIRTWVETDRLGAMQQMGVVPA